MCPLLLDIHGRLRTPDGGHSSEAAEETYALWLSSSSTVPGPLEPENTGCGIKIHQLAIYIYIYIQWIGFRKNLQETMVFTIKYRDFL